MNCTLQTSLLPVELHALSNVMAILNLLRLEKYSFHNNYYSNSSSNNNNSGSNSNNNSSSSSSSSNNNNNSGSNSNNNNSSSSSNHNNSGSNNNNNNNSSSSSSSSYNNSNNNNTTNNKSLLPSSSSEPSPIIPHSNWREYISGYILYKQIIPHCMSRNSESVLLPVINNNSRSIIRLKVEGAAGMN
jgi:hypothetical protein